jgi:transposase
MSSKTYFGIDVSKDSLDFHGPGVQGKASNNPAVNAGSWPICPSRLTWRRSQWGYECALVAAAHKTGVAVFVLNLRRVRDFARALGRLAKADSIDAQTVAHFGQNVAPLAGPIPSQAPLALAELVTTRQQLVEQRTVVLQ